MSKNHYIDFVSQATAAQPKLFSIFYKIEENQQRGGPWLHTCQVT